MSSPGSLTQILDDPSPSPSECKFSPEFCSFVDACLEKDPDARPTAEQVNNCFHMKLWISVKEYNK